MSELEAIAASVNSVASEITTVVQQLAAQAVRNRQTAARANVVLSGSSDPRPKQVTQQLDAAAERCTQAAETLLKAEAALKEFVGRIVGGGSGGGAGSSTGGSNTPTVSAGSAAGKALAQSASNNANSLVAKAQSSVQGWSPTDQALATKWFGDAGPGTRDALAGRLSACASLLASAKFADANPADAGPGTFAYVFPRDATHTIYLADAFWNASDSGPDSKAGVLLHEISHFPDGGATHDHAYGWSDCRELAKRFPELAMDNADNFEYFLEEFL